MNRLERIIKSNISVPVLDCAYRSVEYPKSPPVPGTQINFASHKIGKDIAIAGIESLRTEFNITDTEVEGVIYSSVRDDNELYISASLTGSGVFGVNVACFDTNGRTTGFFRPKMTEPWPLPAVKAIKSQLEERAGIEAWMYREYWLASYRELPDDTFAPSPAYVSFIRELGRLCDKNTMTDDYIMEAITKNRFYTMGAYLGFPYLSQVTIKYEPKDVEYGNAKTKKLFDMFGISQLNLEFVAKENYIC